MKRFFFAFFGACFGALLSISLAYLAGQVWGPLYHGEDQSTRNFKLFLLVTGLLLISGGMLGYRFSKPKSSVHLN
jgi:heme/copper-type cytochrome/quinol oxidase subunit 3